MNVQYTQDAVYDELFIDYKGKQLNSMYVNGKLVAEEGFFRDHRIYIPTKH